MPARATTDVEAANLALSIVNEPPIGSFDEQRRTAARAARKWYGTALDKALGKTDWNFATAWAMPAVDPIESAGILKYRFPLPADCVRVRFVYDGEAEDDNKLGPDEWALESAIITAAEVEVEAKVLVCSVDSVTICYTRRITNVALWDGDFLLAFAHRLARYLASELGKSKTEVAELKAEANDESDEAANRDAKEKARPQVSRDTSWIQARR